MYRTTVLSLRQQTLQTCADRMASCMTSAPFHPSSSGEAERLVGVFKRAMQRSVGEPGEEGLGKDQAARALLREYRSTLHGTTGRTLPS